VLGSRAHTPAVFTVWCPRGLGTGLFMAKNAHARGSERGFVGCEPRGSG
jgi:hypothetical protein